MGRKALLNPQGCGLCSSGHGQKPAQPSPLSFIHLEACPKGASRTPGVGFRRIEAQVQAKGVAVRVSGTQMRASIGFSNATVTPLEKQAVLGVVTVSWAVEEATK